MLEAPGASDLGSPSDNGGDLDVVKDPSFQVVDLKTQPGSIRLSLYPGCLTHSGPSSNQLAVWKFRGGRHPMGGMGVPRKNDLGFPFGQ